MFKLEVFESYHKVPLIGYGGGLELTYTGADDGVDTATVVH